VCYDSYVSNENEQEKSGKKYGKTDRAKGKR
jgi:hypothetical protein